MKKIIALCLMLLVLLPGCNKEDTLKEITKEEALEIFSKVNENINDKREEICNDELSFVVYYKSDTLVKKKSNKVSIKTAKSQVSLNHITNEISMYDKKKQQNNQQSNQQSKTDKLIPVKKYVKYNEKIDCVDYYMIYDNFFEFDRTHKKFDNGKEKWNQYLISVGKGYITFEDIIYLVNRYKTKV